MIVNGNNSEEKNSFVEKSENEDKKINKAPKIISKNQFRSIMVVLILLAIILLAFSVNDNFLNPVSDDKPKKNNNQNNSEIPDSNQTENKNLNISYITTASGIIDDRYLASNFFSPGDKIFVWIEFENICHGNNISANLEYNILYKDKVTKENKTLILSLDCFSYYFFNFTSNDSWSEGEYTINVNLTDKINVNYSIVNFSFLLKDYDSDAPFVGINTDPDPPEVLEGEDIIFNSTYDNIEGEITTHWNFGDNNNSINENVRHFFTNEGEHIIILSVSNETVVKSNYTTVDVSSDNTSDDLYGVSFEWEHVSGRNYIFTAYAFGGTKPYNFEWDLDYNGITFDITATGRKVIYEYSEIVHYPISILLKVTDSSNPSQTETYYDAIDTP